MRRSSLLAFVCASSLLLSGCATVSTVKRSEGGGVTKRYPYAFDQVFAKLRGSLGEVGLNLVETQQSSDGTRGSVIASKGLSLFSYGERVAVFLTKRSEYETEVEVVSKRVLATNILAKDWTQDIFQTLDRRLAEETREAIQAP